jgi:hypothetical protein
MGAIDSTASAGLVSNQFPAVNLHMARGYGNDNIASRRAIIYLAKQFDM